MTEKECEKCVYFQEYSQVTIYTYDDLKECIMDMHDGEMG